MQRPCRLPASSSVGAFTATSVMSILNFSEGRQRLGAHQAALLRGLA